MPLCEAREANPARWSRVFSSFASHHCAPTPAGLRCFRSNEDHYLSILSQKLSATRRDRNSLHLLSELSTPFWVFVEVADRREHALGLLSDIEAQRELGMTQVCLEKWHEITC